MLFSGKLRVSGLQGILVCVSNRVRVNALTGLFEKADEALNHFARKRSDDADGSGGVTFPSQKRYLCILALSVLVLHACHSS